MKTKLIFSLILFLIVFSTVVTAFTIADGKKEMTALISGGGTNLSSTEYKGYVAIGQPVINPETAKSGGDIIGGNLTSENYTLCLGIFCTEAFEIPHSINITGRITYDIGGDVANSEAILKVKYGLATFESEPVETDDNGVFNATLNIPERIARYPFDIAVYASGRVDAEYTCTYNHTSSECK